jgi:putative FmdB family regulatory protein
MPIYEYRCTACGFQSEYLRKVTDPALAVCPECGRDTFRKLVTAAGFQLKGSGWYATDFKHRGEKPAAAKSDAGAKGDADTKKENAPGADPTPSAESKAESKSAGESKQGGAAPAAGGAGGSAAS